MASETAADLWIYYKDAKNWFHGPFMVPEVQYRYSREWLKNSFQVYFLAGDERPDKDTKYRTLADLITNNGADDPFVFKKSEAQLANEWAAYYLDVLEACKESVWTNVDLSDENPIFASMKEAINSDTFREKCREELEKKLKELDYAYCKECKSVFHNYKHMIMHVDVKQKKKSAVVPHVEIIAVNEMMKQIFEPSLKKWKEEEDKFPKEDIHKYDASFASVGLPVPNLYPTKEFIQKKFKNDYVTTFYYHCENVGPSFKDQVVKMFPRLKNDKDSSATILEVFNKLDVHIADAKTRCFCCNMFTGSREDYYSHLRTFDHIKNADENDLITLVVNLYKKD